MRRWLEFHDSDFVSLVHDTLVALVELNGYVHQWEQDATGWTGTGWHQRVQIAIRNPSVRIVQPTGPCDDDEPAIAKGSLTCGPTTHENLLPLPFSSEGNCRLDLEMNIGRSVQIAGTDVSVQPVGEPEFVEALRDDFRPVR